MKKAKIAVIIIAVIMVLVGGAIAFYGIASIGFDFDKLATSETVTHDYPVDVDFEFIWVEALFADVKIAQSTDGKCRVAATDNERVQLSVYVENGILKIVQTDERKWYERIGIFTTKSEIVVYLPKTEYDIIRVTNDVGDITVPSDFTFASAIILTDTGDIEFYSKLDGYLSVSTDTGDITINSTEINNLNIQTDTGDVEISSLNVKNIIRLQTGTGKVVISDTICEQIQSKTTTDKVTLDNVIASYSMSLETSTGSVKLDMCDAEKIYIKTSTGSVTGTLLSAKQFFTKTSTGKISVPPSGDGGRCEIETSTGDIRIEISDQSK